MGTWNNNDGLYIKFGTEEAAVSTAGEYRTNGPLRMVELQIPDLTVLTTTDTIMDDAVVIPAGAFVEKVELITTTAVTSGGSATLDVGLIASSDRSTEVDHDGFIAAGAIATFNAAGETVEYTEGSTGHGALIGTAVATTGHISAAYGTAAFTAGAVTIRIYFSF